MRVDTEIGLKLLDALYTLSGTSRKGGEFVASLMKIWTSICSAPLLPYL
jgi:hypothetical protein